MARGRLRSLSIVPPSRTLGREPGTKFKGRSCVIARMTTPRRIVALGLVIALAGPTALAQIYIFDPPVAYGTQVPDVVRASCEVKKWRCVVEPHSYTYGRGPTDPESPEAVPVRGSFTFSLPGWADSASIVLVASDSEGDEAACTSSCRGKVATLAYPEPGQNVDVIGVVTLCDWWCADRKDYPYVARVTVV